MPSVPRVRGDEPAQSTVDQQGVCVPRVRGDEPLSVEVYGPAIVFPAYAGMNRERKCGKMYSTSVFPAYAGMNRDSTDNGSKKEVFPAYAGMNRCPLRKLMEK